MSEYSIYLQSTHPRMWGIAKLSGVKFLSDFDPQISASSHKKLYPPSVKKSRFEHKIYFFPKEGYCKNEAELIKQIFEKKYGKA